MRSSNINWIWAYSMIKIKHSQGRTKRESQIIIHSCPREVKCKEIARIVCWSIFVACVQQRQRKQETSPPRLDFRRSPESVLCSPSLAQRRGWVRGGSPIGFFNPLIPTQNFVQSHNPDGYFWYPTSPAYLHSQISPQFYIKFPNPELQLREIPDPVKPIGDPLLAHVPGQRLVIEPFFLITKALDDETDIGFRTVQKNAEFPLNRDKDVPDSNEGQ